MSAPLLADLSALFAEVIDVSGIRMEESAVLGEDVPVDSKEMLRVLARIEARYGFRFDPREVLRLETLGDLVAVVRSRGRSE